MAGTRWPLKQRAVFSLIPSAARRSHLLRLLAGICQQPRQAERGATDLTAALARARAVIRRRALIMIVSDFLVPDGWQPALRRLAQRHEATAVRLYDPRERELPDVGLITLEDPEDSTQQYMRILDPKGTPREARIEGCVSHAHNFIGLCITGSAPTADEKIGDTRCLTQNNHRLRRNWSATSRPSWCSSPTTCCSAMSGSVPSSRRATAAWSRSPR